MNIGIAMDHAGFALEEELVARARAPGHEVADFGAYQLMPEDDYPDVVAPLAQVVVAGKVVTLESESNTCAPPISRLAGLLSPREQALWMHGSL
jgi:hypothetical protein